MRPPQVRFTVRRALLGVALIAGLLGVASWARRNLPISYEAIPTRVGPSEYRAYYADGTFRQKGGQSGHGEREPKSGRWVMRP